MKDLFIVTKFTMKDLFKRKSFIITTILFLIIIIVGFNVPNFMKVADEIVKTEKIEVVDSDDVFENTLENLKNSDIGYNIEISSDSYEEISNKVKNEEITAAIIIEKQNENIELKYIVKNSTMMTEAPEEIISIFETAYTNLQLNKLNLTDQQKESLKPNFNVSLEQTEESANGNVLVMMLLSIVLFYAIYFCAYQVSNSITSEKTSKIIETLVTSTSPRTIVIGKTLGIGLGGLMQVILLLVTAIFSAKIFLEPELLNSIIDVSSITPYLLAIILIYFLLGYFVFALLYALTGSPVSRPEDIPYANMPIALITVGGFYLSYFTMMNPTSNLNIFASMCPISSPFCMPFRVMMGLARPIDVLISILILIITGIIIAKIAIKIYSSAILNYGTKITLKDIIKIYKDKNN